MFQSAKIRTLSEYELILLMRSWQRLMLLLCLPTAGGLICGLLARGMGDQITSVGCLLIIPLYELIRFFDEDLHSWLKSLKLFCAAHSDNSSWKQTICIPVSQACSGILTSAIGVSLFAGTLHFIDPQTVPPVNILFIAYITTLIIKLTVAHIIFTYTD